MEFESQGTDDHEEKAERHNKSADWEDNSMNWYIECKEFHGPGQRFLLNS